MSTTTPGPKDNLPQFQRQQLALRALSKTFSSLFLLIILVLPFIFNCPGKEQPPPKERLPLDAALAAQETRAGQIKQTSELIKGPQALNTIGDWKIYNTKVAFVIQGKGLSRTWSGSTGQLIDASPINSSGKAQGDLLEEIFPAFGVLRVPLATKIQVIEAGGKGKSAILRVTADNKGIPILDAALQTERLPATIEIDYILRPEAQHIEIVTRLKEHTLESKLLLGDVALFGDHTRTFSKILGWTRSNKLMGKKPNWLAGIANFATQNQGGLGTTYLITPADKTVVFQLPIAQFEVLPLFGLDGDHTKEVIEYKRLFFVSDNGVETLLQKRRALQKEAGYQLRKGTISGLSKETPAEITLLGKDNIPISQTFADKTGQFAFQISSGTYKLQAHAPGHPTVRIPLSNNTDTKVVFSPKSGLQLQIKEKKLDGSLGSFIPVRLQMTGPQNQLVNITKQAQHIPLPPGKYTLLVSRGLEYEYHKSTVTLQGGKTTQLQIELQRAVEVHGVQADMHLHAAPSIDSNLPLEQRVASLVAEGIQFAAATDHDTLTDYRPIIQKMQLEQWLQSVIGMEVSPLVLHTNMFPVTSPKNHPKYFGLPYVTYDKGSYQGAFTAPQIWTYGRKHYKAGIIQINHPRSFQAYFDIIKFDPTEGIASIKKGTFDSNWDTIEVYNGKSESDDFLNSTMKDWFALLNQGYYKTAVGNSDSHSSGRRPGIPRTIIKSSAKDMRKADTNEIIANLKKGRAQVYSGPYILAKTVSDKGPGDTVVGKVVELEIQIHAPSWVPVSYVKLVENGKVIQELQVPDSNTRMRFRKMLRLQPKKDAWYVVIAGHAEKTLTPIYPKFRSVSMTNPIYIDVDGKGFQAPKP